MQNFVHLHVHTDASLKDGLGPVTRLVKHAKDMGFEALAMTDHGSLANAIAFTIACNDNGIKPILGVEAYVEVDGKVGHMTLLADGDAGWHNIVHLNNLGHAGKYKRPAFSLQQLLDHNEGIVLLSGCQSSPLQEMSEPDAIALAARIKAVFGKRFFAEAMHVNSTPHAERALLLARECGLKLVVTNDAHFPYPADAPLHPVLTHMKAGYSYDSGQLYLKNRGQMLHAMRGTSIKDDRLWNEALDNTMKIAKYIKAPNLKREPALPHIDDPDTRLSIAARAGLEHRYIWWDESGKAAANRLEYELEVIRTMGYSSYFLILDDIVRYARKNGVRIGPGRGSGAGSIVLYCLGITDIDPLKYGLSFERFLNIHRVGMPDVDMDFDAEHRHLVLEYAKKQWNATPIATYSRYSHKSLVHDLCKQLKLPRGFEKQVADLLPESKEFASLAETKPEFYRAYQAFIGQIRHKGKHAGGVVITEGSVPIERAGDELVAAWTEGHSAELTYAGIVKFDLLGLSALSALDELEKKLGLTAPREMPDNDPVYEIFCKGELSGIFQFSGSSGIRDLCMALQPNKFEDLVAVNALYRPGALDVGTAQKYPEWKKAPRRIHPLIDDILAPTYGVIVYQEQVMSLFARIMSKTMAEADNARRIIFKIKAKDEKWEAQVMGLEHEFKAACKDAGIRDKIANMLWSEIFAHTRYSFNKAHAVSYARVAYEMAWWKYYHRADFYAAMLNIDPGNAQSYILSAEMEGIPIHMPNVNCKGSDRWNVNAGYLQMPLTAGKYVSSVTAKAIMLELETNGAFKSAKEFMARVPKAVVRANARESLAAMGAMPDSFPRSTAGKSVWSDLGLKPEKFEDLIAMSAAGRQLKYTGFILPSPKLISMMTEARDDGLVFGIITEVEPRKSTYGPYFVYRYMPSGVCWSREIKLDVGQSVLMKIDEGKLVGVSKHYE